MTYEELSAEAKKQGYRLVAIHRYVRYLPCKCGANRRDHFHKNELIGLRCKSCGFTVTAKSEWTAVQAWNREVNK